MGNNAKTGLPGTVAHDASADDSNIELDVLASLARVVADEFLVDERRAVLLLWALASAPAEA